MVGQFILAVAVFICDLCVKEQLSGVIIQRFSCVLGFTAVEPLSVN